ncbi:RNA-binding protein 5-like isoform X2 [Tachypleus tridentatus]|uniref:RNA-binding protein 5-like isoform X2 n=2 Tax=Tachypleus tridentatus TaxID=6853 RepID=UPI003FD13E2A
MADQEANKSDRVKLIKGIQSSTTISAGSQGIMDSKLQANQGSVVVDCITYKKYLPPSTSTYQYDDTSGYYCDPSTGLYYDANSQYYYNAEAQLFLYWDGEKQTYLPALTQTQAAGNMDTESTKDENSKNRHKQVKVYIAKKIAKEMERWAETLNQKKESAKLGLTGLPSKNMLEHGKQSAAADAGFIVLEKGNILAERQTLVLKTLRKELQEAKKFQMPLTGYEYWYS